MLYYLPVVLTIVSSILYHLFLKVTPPTVNPILSLSITYITAAAVTLIVYPFFPSGKEMTVFSSLRELNWASYALGLAVVGLEVGALLAYGAGWNISLFNVVYSSAVTILLIPIGLLAFKEALSSTTIIGLLFCLAGLILINYKM